VKAGSTTARPFRSSCSGLGLLGLHELGEGGWRWWAIDVLWAVAGGLALGWLLGTLVGRAILYLRMRHREALGSDEFIALGLIGLTYGLALLSHTYGFLAVFAAGLALRRIDEPHVRPQAPAPARRNAEPRGAGGLRRRSAGPHDARGGALQQPARKFCRSRHRAGRRRAGGDHALSHRGAVVHPGAVPGDTAGAVYLGLLGTPVRGTQRRLMGWFGIRGIGSLYYLLYAINHHIERALAQQLLSITLAVVVASVVAHGVSVTPLMKRYEARKAGGAAA
jgi:NhaP-type Na+/H+ or K+/H+ antiporter